MGYIGCNSSNISNCISIHEVIKDWGMNGSINSSSVDVCCSRGISMEDERLNE